MQVSNSNVQPALRPRGLECLYLVNSSAGVYLVFFFLPSNQRLFPVIKGAGNIPTYSQIPYGSSRAAQIM